MKVSIAVFAVFFLSSVCFASFFPFEYEERKLKNGLTVVSIKTPTPGQAAMMTIVRTGSRDEYEPGHTGFAHLFEHMMFRGTKTRPGNEYYAATQAVGADTNASTGADTTMYHLNFAAEDLDFILSIEADRFMNLSYSKEDFKTETGAVLGEYLGNISKPYRLTRERLQETAFKKHTYRHTTMGFEKDIRNMPTMYDYSLSFYKRYYRPENTVLLIMGDVAPHRAHVLVKKHFGSWKGGYVPPKVPKEPPQRATRRAHVDFPGRATPTITLAFKAPAFSATSKEAVCCEILGQLLFSRQSDAFQKLVVKEKLALRLHERFKLSRDPGLLTVTAALKDEKDGPKVEAMLLAEIKQCIETGPKAERVKEVISHEKYDFLNELAHIKWSLFEIGDFLSFGGSMKTLENYFATLNRITPKDIQQAARKYLRTRSMTVITLTGAEDKKAPKPWSAEIVELPEKSDPTTSITHWFKVGSQDDPKGKEGLWHLTTKMIVGGGTQNKTFQELQRAYFPFAPYIDGRTDKEMTTFSVQLHKDNQRKFYELWREMVFTPAFRQEDFTRIKEQTLQYLDKELRYSNDEELAKQTLQHYLFAGSAYSHPNNGYIESVRSITLQDVKDFHAKHFTQDRLVSGLGGSYAKTLALRIKKDSQRLGRGAHQAPLAPAPAAPKGLEIVIVEKESKSTAISAAFPLKLLRNDTDFIPLLIANSWLGEHRNSISHLFQVIRAKRGLNYGDYSYIEAFPEGQWREFPPPNVCRRKQLFQLWIRSVRNEQAVFALKAALRELEKLVKRGLTKEQFEKTQKFLSKYCHHYAKTTQHRLAYKLDDMFYGVEEGYLETLSSKIKKATLAQVNKAIRKHLQAKNMKIVLVTGAPDLLFEQLKKNKPTPVTYRTPKSAEIVREDKLIEAYRLNVSSIERVKNSELFLGR